MSFSVEPLTIAATNFPEVSRITVRGPMRGKEFTTVHLAVRADSFSRNLFGELECSLVHRPKRPRRPTHTQDDKLYLFKKQEGKCNGCIQSFLITDPMELDHFIPLAWSGTDRIENWQLLCPKCNHIKGDRSMAYLVGRQWHLGFFSVYDHPYFSAN